ncbi:MAG TPA: DUF6090 family protein [Flavobacteriales bacterium]|nr:DUF6090 family protein [Flavobacteriales bacterium]
MPRLFNTIRQRLLKENRLTRYLVYAVGEIVLVVIGILIAVQVNDWNELRKIKRSNSAQLQKMVAEMEVNIARMELLTTNKSGLMSYGYAPLEVAVANCDTLLKLSYAGLSEKDLPFILKGRFFAGQSILNLQQDVFEELKSTGRLNSLGSDSLVAAIKNYNKRFLRDEYYTQLHIQRILRDLQKMENGLGKLLLDHEMSPGTFSLANYPWFHDPASREYQDMQTAIASAQSSQRQTMVKMQEIATLSQGLIDMIKKELDANEQ